jgi:uncharacterized membrane protein HdeD (DUF308 family)
MADIPIIDDQDPLFGQLSKRWGWVVAFGVLSTILGIIGLGMTFGLTLAGVLVFGVLLVIGGGFQLVDAFMGKGWRGTLLQAAIAVVYLIAGVLMIFDPAGAAIALTLILGAALLTVGALRIAIAIQHRGERGWKWAVAGGIASLLLGGLILLEWPTSGLWVIGLFIALELLINGWTAIFIGLAARRAKQRRDRSAESQDDAATGRTA